MFINHETIHQYFYADQLAGVMSGNLCNLCAARSRGASAMQAGKTDAAQICNRVITDVQSTRIGDGKSNTMSGKHS